MRTLSIWVRNWCVHWTSASGTDTHPKHMHQFLTCMLSRPISLAIFKILYTLSMRVRNWCMHFAIMPVRYCICWAYVSETDAWLSIRVSYWCMHWAYMSGTIACTELSPFKTCWAYASGTDVYPDCACACTEHASPELMRTLSIRISLLRICSV